MQRDTPNFSKLMYYIFVMFLFKISIFNATKAQSSEFPTSFRFMGHLKVFTVSGKLVYCVRLSLVSNSIVWAWKQNGVSF